MKNSKNRKSNVNINYLPSCEINSFLQSVSTHQSREQKNNILKEIYVEENNKSRNASILPPSCELSEIGKDSVNFLNE